MCAFGVSCIGLKLHLTCLQLGTVYSGKPPTEKQPYLAEGTCVPPTSGVRARQDGGLHTNPQL